MRTVTSHIATHITSFTLTTRGGTVTAVKTGMTLCNTNTINCLNKLSLYMYKIYKQLQFCLGDCYLPTDVFNFVSFDFYAYYRCSRIALCTGSGRQSITFETKKNKSTSVMCKYIPS